MLKRFIFGGFTWRPRFDHPSLVGVCVCVWVGHYLALDWTEGRGEVNGAGERLPVRVLGVCHVGASANKACFDRV